MLTPDEANGIALTMEKDARTEWARLGRFTRYSRGQQRPPWLPESAEAEYREIAKKSAANWLDLVVTSTAQGLVVDGFGESELVWSQAWQANAMDARQHALHRAALVHGYAFQIVLPAADGGVVMRPEAATSMTATYESEGDEWPIRALRKVGKDLHELYDSDARYTLTGQLGRATVTTFDHGLGVCPVARAQSQFDLLGMPRGEIEPVISIQDRIVDATFNLQMVAKYGAFPQRWIAGMSSSGVDENGQPIAPAIKAYVDSILLAADADTKFGQFQAADLRQFVDALEAHIRHLAAITQTPPHYLLGSMANLAAEAIAAAEAGLHRKIRERREALGEGHEQALRLAALILGDPIASDPTAQVHWQDVESRSLAQVSDALLKLGQLGVPAKKLFPMIPGWTQTDVSEAMQEMASGGGIDSLLRELTAGQTSPTIPAA